MIVIRAEVVYNLHTENVLCAAAALPTITSFLDWAWPVCDGAFNLLLSLTYQSGVAHDNIQGLLASLQGVQRISIMLCPQLRGPDDPMAAAGALVCSFCPL